VYFSDKHTSLFEAGRGFISSAQRFQKNSFNLFFFESLSGDLVKKHFGKEIFAKKKLG
jgi:hypothetical protein